jgi:methyl-accepting chemotaxis protein
MARAIVVFRDSMAEGQRLAAIREADQALKSRRAAALEALTRSFNDHIGGLIDGLGSAADDMQATARAMADTATTARGHCAVARDRSADTAGSVEAVAAATEQLSASIQEISRQVETSARFAQTAVLNAGATDGTVTALTDGAERIGQIVHLIQNIASQTNLLALNASIEAVRAGDAGRGFAVVAGEVKALAAQTAHATEDIARQIDTIRTVSTDAATAIRDVGSTIAEINRIAAALAAAIVEQSAATEEIARSIQSAVAGSRAVSETVTGLDQAATETGATAAQVLTVALTVADPSAGLRTEIESFLTAAFAA